MADKYADWVRAQIRDHAPDGSEPQRVQSLALAAYNLSKGAGTLFGMHWPTSGISETDDLRDEALEQLAGWFKCLDEHDAVEVARFIEKHALQVPIPSGIIELLRRVESREGLELPDPSAAQTGRMTERIASAPTVIKTTWLNVQAAAQATMLGLQRLQWFHEPFMVEPPATATHLAAIENELPFALPDDFVHVMGLWGRTAFFTWSPPDDRSGLPAGTEALGEGGFDMGLWDLGRVLQLKTQCDVWRDVARNPPGSAEDLWWERALPFAGQEGKYLALYVSSDASNAPVMFLDSTQGEGHGWQLGPSLHEFLIDWAELGFPGESIASFAPFHTSERISLDTDTARRWREFLFQS